jgi:hypothetical protein
MSDDGYDLIGEATKRGHNAPCGLCREPCNALHGNPTLWPIMLPFEGGQRAYHTGCLCKAVRRELFRKGGVPTSDDFAWATAQHDLVKKT